MLATNIIPSRSGPPPSIPPKVTYLTFWNVFKHNEGICFSGIPKNKNTIIFTDAIVSYDEDLARGTTEKGEKFELVGEPREIPTTPPKQWGDVIDITEHYCSTC
jgi:hypothetical protein